MTDIIEAMRSAGVDPRSFVVSGGLSQLSYLTQFQADMLGKDLFVSAEQEASALGAALLAGLGLGTWTIAGICGMVRRGEEVTGEKNPGAEKRYRRWKELHRMTRELDRME
jgi:glycerol kinase